MENFKKWIDRDFEFGTPLWMFPNILERLRGTPFRVENLIKSIPKMYLRKKYENQWSIQENIGHLLDLEPLSRTRFEEYNQGKEILSSADLSNAKTHEANHNESSLINLLPQFNKLRNETIEILETVSDQVKTRTLIHPRLNKPMNLMDLMYFMAEHDDHHLASITRIIKEYEKNNDNAST